MSCSAFWWCIVTLVTVGYGDFTTITPPGHVVGIITQLSGVIVLALPLSIIGANFHEEREKINREIEVQILTRVMRHLNLSIHPLSFLVEVCTSHMS